MIKKKLICNMLGGISLIYDGHEIALKSNETSKVMQLFLMLLYAGAGGIHKSRLMTNLYGLEEIQDTKNALRILVFRLKKLIKETELPEDDYILTQKGVCYFGGQLEILIDAKAFGQAAASAREMDEGEARLEALIQACEMYTGEFLPQLSTEEWVMAESLRYKNIYYLCVQEACEALKGQERYEEMLRLYSRASDLYPFEEWQVMVIDCLIALNRYNEALKLYREVTTLFFDELGLLPSEKMLEQFKIMSGRIKHADGNLPQIQDTLREQEQKRSAYYCSYPSFVDSYRVLARLTERTGTSIFLMLCSLTDHRGMPLEKEEMLEEEMARLCAAIELSLRRSDIFTRYSPSQALILLVGVGQENCRVIYNRIYQNFKNRAAGRRVGVSYHVLSIADIQRVGLGIKEDRRQGGWNDGRERDGR